MTQTYPQAIPVLPPPPGHYTIVLIGDVYRVWHVMGGNSMPIALSSTLTTSKQACQAASTHYRRMGGLTKHVALLLTVTRKDVMNRSAAIRLEVDVP